MGDIFQLAVLELVRKAPGTDCERQKLLESVAGDSPGLPSPRFLQEVGAGHPESEATGISLWDVYCLTKLD